MKAERGYVYFVRCGDFVKIGFAEWPEYRMKFLAVASPLPMEMIAKFPGAVAVERWAHQQVKQHKHRGEWFHWHPDIEALIASGLQDFPRVPTEQHVPIEREPERAAS